MNYFTEQRDISKIQGLLELAVSQDATDVHLVVGQKPIFRLNGELMPADLPVMDSETLEGIVLDLLTTTQREKFKEIQEVDFSYSCLEDYYFRFNFHIEKGNVAATIRIMPHNIKTAEELLLPPIIEKLCAKRQGLVLITGPTGCGKTTTMTYMIDFINRTRRCKIITIEDPIEFIHQSKQSLIIQREVGSHTQSFSNGLKYALRQDPDVVIIGEIRDLESISMALTTAETGHLVLTTLHSPNAIESINRIVDVYPSGKQNQIRYQLAENLEGIIGQNLIPVKNSKGRILATEVLLPTLPIRNMVRRGALTEIRGQMSTSGDIGMYNMEQCLSYLAKKGRITRETAREHAKHPEMLEFD